MTNMMKLAAVQRGDTWWRLNAMRNYVQLL